MVMSANNAIGVSKTEDWFLGYYDNYIIGMLHTKCDNRISVFYSNSLT